MSKLSSACAALSCHVRWHRADVVNTFFKTSIAVGLLIALILDNTLPGSKEDRGLTHWNMTGGYKSMTEKGHKAYDLPFGLSPKVRDCYC